MKGLWLRPLLLLFLVATTGGGASVVWADPYVAANVDLGRNYIAPGYAALAESAADQLKQLKQFCRAPDAAGLELSRAAFHATMDDWMRMQHISFGPIANAFRAQRLYHWPERRHAVARELDTLMSTRDAARLKPEAFTKSSVAVQGLPALERLLFASDALQRYQQKDENSRYRCALTIAIVANINDIAQALPKEWRNVQMALGSGGGSLYFYNSKNASKKLLEDLAVLFQFLADLKLERVLAASAEQSRPELAESYRSARSKRNMVINLQSAAAMYGTDHSGGFSRLVRSAEGGEALDQRMQSLFAEALTALRGMPAPVASAVVDPKQWQAIREVLTKIETLRDAYRQDVPQHVGIALGYTSFGD